MDAKEDIKAKLSVEEVAEDYLELKRAGRNHKALSPFSSEKTASLMISPEKQIWHDFSSGKGGDMFTLVMELEGVDFKGALEILAKKAGIDLSKYQRGDGGRSKLKNRLLEANELAAKFYQVHFSKNKEAWDYIFKKRGYTKETALAFRLGYSPNNGDALVKFLQSKKFTSDEIQKAGLATFRYNRLNDMFRGRIMVPLMDSRGQVIGFTARLLAADDNGPKYINTPMTMLYDKSRHAYGLNLAKDDIRKSKFVVVVEGNMDVVASHQAGVKNVVATAGTAMTEQHLKELMRFSDDIRIAFDQDQAGLNATERMIPVASKVGAKISIITVPQGKDPDELIKKDPGLWVQAINTYDYATDWLIKQYTTKLDLSSGSGKKQLTDTVLPVVAQLTDSVERDHYLTKLAELLEVSKPALMHKLSEQKAPKKRYKPTKVVKIPKEASDALKTQNHFISIVLVNPELRKYLKPVRDDMLADENGQEVLRLLQRKPDFDAKNAQEVAKELLSRAEYCRILSVLYEELYGSLDNVELDYEAARLQSRVLKNYTKTKKAELAEQLRTADDEKTEELLQEVKKLDVLLKSAAGER
ncbi:MAG: DNA primase [bacterium]|nr:DNA primase [bacterium]